MINYMDHQHDRLRELEIEIIILDKVLSLEDRETIEYCISHSEIYWPVSDKWKKRRADFVHRYDETSYKVTSIEKDTSLYDTHYAINETMWENHKDTLLEESHVMVKKYNSLQSLRIFEIQWEINAIFNSTNSFSFYTYRKMEREITAMNLNDYHFTQEWYTRRSDIYTYICNIEANIILNGLTSINDMESESDYTDNEFDEDSDSD